MIISIKFDKQRACQPAGRVLLFDSVSHRSLRFHVPSRLGYTAFWLCCHYQMCTNWRLMFSDIRLDDAGKSSISTPPVLPDRFLRSGVRHAGFHETSEHRFCTAKSSQRIHEIAAWLITRSKIPHTILVVSIVSVAWANLNCVVVVAFRSPSCFADMSLEMVLSSVGLSTLASEWSGLNWSLSTWCL